MFADYDRHWLLLLIIFVPVIVWVISKILILVHCIALALTMHKKKVLHPILSFISIARHFSEGYVVSDCLKLSFGKALACKILYTLPSVLPSTTTICSWYLSDETEILGTLMKVDNVEELSSIVNACAEPTFSKYTLCMIALCILSSLILLGVSCYIEITRFFVLKSVGYSVVHSLLIILFLSSFYLYFVNSRLEVEDEKVVRELR